MALHNMLQGLPLTGSQLPCGRGRVTGRYLWNPVLCTGFCISGSATVDSRAVPLRCHRGERRHLYPIM